MEVPQSLVSDMWRCLDVYEVKLKVGPSEPWLVDQLEITASTRKFRLNRLNTLSLKRPEVVCSQGKFKSISRVSQEYLITCQEYSHWFQLR